MKQFLTVASALALSACGSKKPAPTTPSETMKDPKAELLAAETAAWATAKPVFDKACSACHTTGGKKASKKTLMHFNLDTYPLGGHHTATIGYTIRDVLGINGKKPTMPDDNPGSVEGDDLAKISAWTDAWVAAEKGGAHPAVAHDHDHDHDDDDDDHD
jgi:mono/diheme cytochrome c family protein